MRGTCTGVTKAERANRRISALLRKRGSSTEQINAHGSVSRASEVHRTLCLPLIEIAARGSPEGNPVQKIFGDLFFTFILMMVFCGSGVISISSTMPWTFPVLNLCNAFTSGHYSSAVRARRSLIKARSVVTLVCERLVWDSRRLAFFFFL